MAQIVVDISEIGKLHRTAGAVPGKIYTTTLGDIYKGTKNGRLQKISTVPIENEKAQQLEILALTDSQEEAISYIDNVFEIDLETLEVVPKDYTGRDPVNRYFEYDELGDIIPKNETFIGKDGFFERVVKRGEQVEIVIKELKL